MIALSSTREFLAALRTARNVTLTAYTLGEGRVFDALAQAAARGAAVHVFLEGSVDRDGVAVNDRAAARLRQTGADVHLVNANATAYAATLHCKAALVDGALFLDDRNWPSDGGDTIIRDDDTRDARLLRDALAGRVDKPTSSFAVTKRAALDAQAEVLSQARSGTDVIVESESFGGANRAYGAIERAARAGARVRLLVNRQDLHASASERRALERLVAAGVDVRSCDGEEKFAVVNGSNGWLGSANASAAFEQPDQLDWGMRTNAPEVIAHVRRAFEKRWTHAKPFIPEGS
jgi:phosphatidylserine/phosphatidylglycerophosphate/cardiolipin synthase-like enzyme